MKRKKIILLLPIIAQILFIAGWAFGFIGGPFLRVLSPILILIGFFVFVFIISLIKYYAKKDS